MVVGGLPFSGKSTLLRNMLGIEDTGDENISRLPGLAVMEAAIMNNPYNSCNVPQWLSAITKEDAELLIFAACLAQVCAKRNEYLTTCAFSENETADSTSSEPNPKFQLHIVDEYFERAFKRLRDLCGKLERDGNLHFLQHASLVFMNIWDVGINLAVFEVISMLARKCSGLILLDVLNLHQDTKVLGKRLDLKNYERYRGRYNARKDDERVMQIHRAGTYYARFVSVCNPAPNTSLLIGTHRDDLDENKRMLTSMSAEVYHLVEDKVAEVGFVEALHPQMLIVNAHLKEDATKVCRTVEQMIMEENRFEQSVPLTWIMLRGVLQATGRFFMPKSELWLYANECGLQSPTELESWLSLFQSCMSIVYSQDVTLSSLHDNVIISPFQFVECLDQLYYAEFDCEIRSKSKLTLYLDLLQRGILTHSFAQEVWADDSCATSRGSKCNLMLKVLVDLKISTKLELVISPSTTEPLIVPPSEQFYFLPSLRLYSSHTQLSSKSDSLVIMASHVHHAPFNICSEFVRFIQLQENTKSLAFVPNVYYDVVHLKWIKSSMLEADIYFKLLDLEDVIEVSIAAPKKVGIHDQHFLLLQHRIYSAMKTTCIEFFYEMSQIVKTMNYKLCVVSSSCPSEGNVVHLVPFEIADDRRPNEQLCLTCGRSVSLSQFSELQTLWVTCAYQVCYCV